MRRWETRIYHLAFLSIWMRGVARLATCWRKVVRPQFFFTLGLRLLKRLRPALPLPLATPLTETPGCCSTLSSVVFLMAAGEMRSWSAKDCSSL